MLSILSYAFIETIKIVKNLTFFEKIESTKENLETVKENLEITNENYFLYPSLWNHRMLCTSLIDWSYQMKEFNNSSSEILKKFFTKGYENEIFHIENFLSLLSINTSDESYNPNIIQIEDFQLHYHGYSTKVKNYSIYIKNDVNNFKFNNNLKLNNNLKSKLICAKYLILLMNEIPFGYGNMINYSKLVKWLIDKSNENNLPFNRPKGW